MRGLYIGRFQPYHLGHEAVLEAIAKDVDEIVIVIGSAQESHTKENPFTAGERMEMICSALEEADLRRRCFVVPLQDVKRNSIWVSHLMSMVPHFDLAYSNNPLVVQLFKEAGVEVRRPPMYQRDLYSGTAIRRLMLEGGDWKGLVPCKIASAIEKMGGIARMANVSRSDACRQENLEDL
ncbi:MAG: Nicotinamide-nucleotide adenylyltransferase [Methanosaeta sp. PtaU1.Bin060]|nr:MAG: Nicotinamide-nucleotide adenylyltransferase [Methanosaeta sp. PtaU1.Bin060]